jgi:hypothetical protein
MPVEVVTAPRRDSAPARHCVSLGAGLLRPYPFEDRGAQTLKNIVARRTAMAARRQETAIVRVVTQTIVAAANDTALCANS